MHLRRRKTSSASVADASRTSILQSSIIASNIETRHELIPGMEIKANADASLRPPQRPPLQDQTNWANENAMRKSKEATEKAEAKKRLQAPTMIKRIRFSSVSQHHDTSTKLAAVAAADRRGNAATKIGNQAKRSSIQAEGERLQSHSSNIFATKGPEKKKIQKATIKEGKHRFWH